MDFFTGLRTRLIHLVKTENCFGKVAFLITILGLLLRVSTILWGIPVLPYMGRYHPDEYASYRHAMQFPGNYFNETDFVYGTAVPYVLAMVILPMKAILTPSVWELACWLGMRLVSVLMGAASIVLIYRLAQRFYDECTALLAAGLTAVSFTHSMNSTFATQDIIMGFFLLVCFLALFRAVASGQSRDFILLGAMIGILLSTKITSVVFLGALPVLAVADILRIRNEAFQTTTRWIGWIVVCGLAAFTVFGVTSPSILLKFSSFLDFWRVQKFNWYDRSMVPWSEVPMIWWRISVNAVGAPVLIAFLVGALLPGMRNRKENIAVLAFILLYYVFNRHHILPHYVASIAPFICLYAARACSALIKSALPLFRLAGIGAAAVLLAFSIWGCTVGIYSRFADPRTEAARWLKAHVRPGSTIGFAEPTPPSIKDFEHPPLDGLGLRLVPVDAGRARPDVIIMSSDSYATMQAALRSPYLKNWTWDPNHNANWYNYIPPSSETFRLFDELLRGTGAEYRLEADFEVPDSSFRPVFIVGVRIYRRVTFETIPR